MGNQFKAAEISVRCAEPNLLKPKPDPDKMQFGHIFTDHMIKIYHKKMGGWQKPEIIPFENLVLHPAAKVFHYALEIFEGMKAYRGVDGKIRIFRPNMLHAARMNVAAKRCCLPTFEGEEFNKCLSCLITIDSEWVPKEPDSLYIRPIMIGIRPSLGVAPSDSALFYTILSPVGSYFKSGSTGVSLLANPRYARAWIGGVGDLKMDCNYASNISVQNEALSKGLSQVLWLYGDNHEVTEVGTMNFFMFYINDKAEKELVTPPLNGLILPGRDSILQLAKQFGQFKVCENTITMCQICELLNQERVLECFGAGTACVISPINHISYMGQDLCVPTLEQENPVHVKICETLLGIQYGKVKHPWAVIVDFL